MRATTSELPDFLTVEEAARVLRIGRTAAYGLARLWRDTSGREGLPVVSVGRLLRVPRAALEELAGGAITSTVADERSVRAPEPSDVETSREEPPRRTNHRHRRARSTSGDQPTLPLT